MILCYLELKFQIHITLDLVLWFVLIPDYYEMMISFIGVNEIFAIRIPKNRNISETQAYSSLTLSFSEPSRLVEWLFCTYLSQNPGFSHVIFNHLHHIHWSCQWSHPWRSGHKYSQLSFKSMIWKWQLSFQLMLLSYVATAPGKETWKNSLWHFLPDFVLLGGQTSMCFHVLCLSTQHKVPYPLAHQE